MKSTFQLLAEAVSAGSGTTSEYRWEDLLDAVEAVFAGPFDREAERVMLAILRFDGRLRLSGSSEFPHSMPPEDMLKSFAIQWLVRETGLTHLLEMQRVEATTASPTLASIARATIRGAALPNLLAREIDVVAEVRPSRQREVLTRHLGRRIGHRPAKALPRGSPKAIANKQVTLEHYTVYEMPWTPLRKKSIVNKVLFLQHGRTFLPGRRGRKRPTEEELVLCHTCKLG